MICGSVDEPFATHRYVAKSKTAVLGVPRILVTFD